MIHDFAGFSRLDEAKKYAPEKMDWVRSRIGEWISEELPTNVALRSNLASDPGFQTFLQSTGLRMSDPKEKIDPALRDKLGKYMGQMGRDAAYGLVKAAEDASDLISLKVSRFGKSEEPGRRGRKPGSKNRPKPTDEQREMEDIISKVEAQLRMFELVGTPEGGGEEWMLTPGKRHRGRPPRERPKTDTVSSLRQIIRLDEIAVKDKQDEMRELKTRMSELESSVAKLNDHIEARRVAVAGLYSDFMDELAVRMKMTPEQKDAVVSHFADRMR